MGLPMANTLCKLQYVTMEGRCSRQLHDVALGLATKGWYHSKTRVVLSTLVGAS